MAVIVYYHADCSDGFGAAYAAWRVFGDAARYRPMHHGEAWLADEVAGNTVYVLDFSFPPEQLCAMAGLAQSVLQIDHHATARAPWAGQLRAESGATAGSGIETYTHPELPLRLVFDLSHSGAALAWAHFHPGQPLPLLLAHIEDIDLWRFALPETRAFCRALRLLPESFPVWDELAREAASPEAPAYQRVLADGRAIERFFNREVERLAQSRLVIPVTLPGEPVDALQAVRHGQAVIDTASGPRLAVRGLAINASALFASELGHVLAERSGSFALIWQVAADGEAKASLRGCGRVDVARLAEIQGGGGHPNAAGFRIPLARFLAFLDLPQPPAP